MVSHLRHAEDTVVNARSDLRAKPHVKLSEADEAHPEPPF